MSVCRGIRGATLAEENTASAIHTATRELLAKLIEANHIEEQSVAAAYFTMTPDLNAGFLCRRGPSIRVERHRIDGRSRSRRAWQLAAMYSGSYTF